MNSLSKEIDKLIEEIELAYGDKKYVLEAKKDDDEELSNEEMMDAMDTEPESAEAPVEEPTEDQIPQQGQPNGGLSPEEMQAAGVDPSMGMDPNAAGGMGGGGGIDPATGMPIEEPKSSEEIGRIYELKKIYARLTSAEKYLASSSDPTLLKLRKFISKSIELFDTMISNIETFKPKIDEIIIMYYKFLERTYIIIRKYYKIKEEEELEKEKERKKKSSSKKKKDGTFNKPSKYDTPISI